MLCNTAECVHILVVLEESLDESLIFFSYWFNQSLQRYLHSYLKATCTFKWLPITDTCFVPMNDRGNKAQIKDTAKFSSETQLFSYRRYLLQSY